MFIIYVIQIKKLPYKKEKGLMDMDNSVVIARGGEGWESV